MGKRQTPRMTVCGLCDEVYDPQGERAAMHAHPEPQSGLYRDAWLASKLSYAEWSTTTTMGIAWRHWRAEKGGDT